MNKTETVLLCRYVKAMCPAQAIDEYTPDAWFDVLYDVDLEAAKGAIRDGVRERGWRFIDVAEVVASVRQKRQDRILEWGRHYELPLPPREMEDDPAACIAWRSDVRERIASGYITTWDDLPHGARTREILPPADPEFVRAKVTEIRKQLGRPMPIADAVAEAAADLTQDGIA